MIEKQIRLYNLAVFLAAIGCGGWLIGIVVVGMADTPRTTQNEDVSHEQRAKVMVEINRIEHASEQSSYGDWDAVRSESLNYDVMPRDTEAFKGFRQLKRINDMINDHENRLKRLEAK